MGFLDDLNEKKVYLDTSVFIYSVQAFEKYVDSVDALLGSIADGDIRGITSELTLTEVLTLPKRLGNTAMENAYLNALDSRPNLPVIPIQRKQLILAAEIRNRGKVRTPDAIHIATGEISGCDIFITNDKKWVSFTETKVLLLDSLLVDRP